MKILGYDFKINRELNSIELDASGKVSFEKQIIYLDTDLTEQTGISSMLHEIIEVGNNINEWNLPHPTICGLEVLFFQALTENGVDLTPLLRVK